MVKPTTTNRCAGILLVWTMLLFGCSAGSDSGQGKHSTAGGIVFSLRMNAGQPQGSEKSGPRLKSEDICSDYNIQWISARADDQAGNKQSSGRWLCTERQGKLTGLPEGTYTVIIFGEVGGKTTWRGEASGIEVIHNQQTDAGNIEMKHLFDQEAPTVVQSVPADGAQGVPSNSALTATFDGSIVAQSINADNFFLTRADQSNDQTPIESAVTYDADKHIAILKPSADLLDDTTYAVTISVDKDVLVEDIAGNPIQQAIEWTFTTSSTDNESPHVVSRDPEHGDMNLELHAIVQIRFSDPINPQTITSESCYLQSRGVRIQSALSYDDQLNLVTLTPAGDLPSGRTCQVVVTTAVTDLSGNSMESDDTWSFVTRFPAWYTENTEVPLGIPVQHRIALSKTEQPYISMMGTNELCAIFRSAQNTWEETIIGASDATSIYHDMLIAPHDTMYTAFWSSSNNLNYCWKTLEPGSIGCTPLDSDDPQPDPKGVSIAVADDFPEHGSVVCASYYDSRDSQIVFIAKHIHSTPEIADTNAGEFPSLAVEPTGKAHISYFDETNGHLKYATNKTGTWVTEIADNSAGAGPYSSIALDSSGTPHISYRDENNRLKYAARQLSGEWLIETVYDTIEATPSSSIAIDSSDLAHISFSNQSNGNLMYASKTAVGSWHIAIVDDNCSSSEPSIIIDKEEFIHISYAYRKTSIANPFVRYATTRPQN